MSAVEHGQREAWPALRGRLAEALAIPQADLFPEEPPADDPALLAAVGAMAAAFDPDDDDEEEPMDPVTEAPAVEPVVTQQPTATEEQARWNAAAEGLRARIRVLDAEATTTAVSLARCAPGGCPGFLIPTPAMP